MPLTLQEVEDDADTEGVRVPTEVGTFLEVSIGAKTSDRKVRWRDNRVMAEYIYNRCSGGPEKNIFWEEVKFQF